MVRWLSPQFENREIDASAYANVTSEWMVGCVAPHVEDYMTNIPVPTFVGLQQCEFDGYFDAYPELRAFDFSSVDGLHPRDAAGDAHAHHVWHRGREVVMTRRSRVDFFSL
jgi:hypothetical protein